MGFLFFWVVIGAAAGWIAEQITKSDHSLLMNIGVGVAGAMIGGTLFDFIGFSFGGGWLGSLITALVGALILLYGYKFYKDSQR